MKKMKKTIKYLCIVMISSLVLGVSLVVCGFCQTQPSNKPTLFSPSDLEFTIHLSKENKTTYLLSWTKAENAKGYNISLNGEVIKKTNSSREKFDLTDYVTVNETSVVSITAIGDGKEYQNSAPSVIEFVAEIPTEGLVYNKPAKGGYEVSGSQAQFSERLVFPDMYNGSDVTSITEFFAEFSSEDYSTADGNQITKSIRFPKKLKNIAEGAFWFWTALEEVVLPETVKQIDCQAFRDCTSLKRVRCSSALTCLERDMFYGCTSLEEMQLPKNLVTIERNAFYGCKSLKFISLPNGLYEIGDLAFARCGLLEIDIPDSVKYIGYSAFNNCLNLKNIKFPKGIDFDAKDLSNLSYIGQKVFDNTKWLNEHPDGFVFIGKWLYRYKEPEGANKNIVIDSFPEWILGIEDYAFEDCKNIVSVTLPKSLKKISASLFKGCASLETVIIPEGVYEIGASAFSGCESLTSIEIPQSVELIGSRVFENCTQLKNVTLPRRIKLNVPSRPYDTRSLFYGCENLESIVLPENISELRSSIFLGCTKLVSLEIPEAVELIEDWIIRKTAIKSLIIPVSVKKIFHTAFSGSSLTEIYYCGSEQEWNKIHVYTNSLTGQKGELDTTATIYFYSETEPTEEGNYWHYDTDGTPVVWSKEK